MDRILQQLRFVQMKLGLLIDIQNGIEPSKLNQQLSDSGPLIDFPHKIDTARLSLEKARQQCETIKTSSFGRSVEEKIEETKILTEAIFESLGMFTTAAERLFANRRHEASKHATEHDVYLAKDIKNSLARFYTERTNFELVMGRLWGYNINVEQDKKALREAGAAAGAGKTGAVKEAERRE